MTWPTATAAAESVALPPAVTGARLLKPVPESCSDRYAAGWASADSFLAHGGDMNALPPSEWPEEKAQGFIERLQAEHGFPCPEQPE